MRQAFVDIIAMVRWRFVIAFSAALAVATGVVVAIDASPVVVAIVFGGLSGTLTANLIRSEPPPSR
ncbi:MAG TPA: hypothetical protein VGW75_05900 [Solirubrobacteraceae bacterium]|jgi:hypothetical protein|nr:hypothetical protein [Solirubrobacteraceae bacterium]